MEFIAVHTAADCERVHRLAELIWSEYYTGLIGAAQVRYMLDTVHSCAAIAEQIAVGMSYEILRIDDVDCAYVAYADQGVHCFLSKLYVLAAYRGRGLGTAALQRAISFATSHGLPCMRLGVNKGNNDAIAMYQARGFRLLRDIQIDIGGGFIMDDHLMQLDLV